MRLQDNNFGNTFPKPQRLCSKRRIEQLFQEGQKGFIYPFSYFIRSEKKTDNEVSLLVSVPKKIYKKATDRNLLKRRTREAYRTNKQAFRNLQLQNGTTVSIALIYTAEHKIPYTEIERSVRKILNRMTET